MLDFNILKFLFNILAFLIVAIKATLKIIKINICIPFTSV